MSDLGCGFKWVYYTTEDQQRIKTKEILLKGEAPPNLKVHKDSQNHIAQESQAAQWEQAAHSVQRFPRERVLLGAF